MFPETTTSLQHLAQTTNTPLSLEIEKAEGCYLYDVSGKKYLDLIAGISVNNIGHRHPKVVQAIKEQLDKYLHVMVYGDYLLQPQIQFAELLADNLPTALSCTYLVNSGSEAVEGALKLAKKRSGRTEIIACKNSYHGSTHGAMSVTGSDKYKIGFGDLLPDVKFITFNHEGDLAHITDKTACVIIEPIQGEAGIRLPGTDYLKLLREKCSETGSLLIFDEIQTAFGRTGTLFAFEQYDIVPDILTLAKAMGAGMPIGAFISSNEIMDVLKTHPELGHITTFGGHPLSCAAGVAGLNVLLEEDLMSKIPEKEALFRKLLTHPGIKEIRGKGLLMAIEFESMELNRKVIGECIANGVISDSFLFSESSLRISPPLSISEEEITFACQVICNSIDAVAK